MSLPRDAARFRRARDWDPTHFGIPELVTALSQAANVVRKRYPGSTALHVGDLSLPGGGRHPRHRSHQSGRDADIFFYVASRAGAPAEPDGRAVFTRHGLALAKYAERARSLEPRSDLRFDDAANYAALRDLAQQGHVVWLLVSRGIKARLLLQAIARERDAETLERLTWLLHQPSHVSPHDDHAHIRIDCSLAQQAMGCIERGPEWPWQQGDARYARLAAKSTQALTSLRRGADAE